MNYRSLEQEIQELEYQKTRTEEHVENLGKELVEVESSLSQLKKALGEMDND